MCLAPGEEAGVGDQAVLNDLGVSGAQLAFIKRVEQCWVDKYERTIDEVASDPTLKFDYSALANAFGRVAVPGGDHDPAAHAEVNAEVGPVLGGLAPYRLAPAAGRGERSAGQRGAQLTGGVRAADERVAVVDVRDAPAQRLVGNQAAGGLDLGKLRHSFVFTGPSDRSS